MITMQYDQVGGVIWMIVGIALFIGSTELRWGTLHRPGPGFMPTLIGSLLILLGFLLTFLSTRRREKKVEQVSLKEFWRRGVYSLLASFLYVFLLDPLGFVIATVFLIFSLLKIMGTRKWFTPVLISVLTAAVSYLIFEVWLRINFPKGILKIG